MIIVNVPSTLDTLEKLITNEYPHALTQLDENSKRQYLYTLAIAIIDDAVYENSAWNERDMTSGTKFAEVVGNDYDESIFLHEIMDMYVEALKKHCGVDFRSISGGWSVLHREERKMGINVYSKSDFRILEWERNRHTYDKNRDWVLNDSSQGLGNIDTY